MSTEDYGAAVTAEDLRWLRRAFHLAEQSVEGGDYPFGAVLVSPQDGLVQEAAQMVVRGRDRLGHAELLVLLEAGRKWTKAELSTFTLYSSTEPCPMCTGAAAWCVNRLVFGISQAEMYRRFALPNEAPRFRLAWDCRTVLNTTTPPMEVIGPLLEDEAALAHSRWLARG